MILMLIFIFQMIWLFIDDLAGKGLDLFIIGKFVFYMLPDLIEKVLPLTVLLASILTFGEFAEHYEFAAMKASGISLQRAMRSLILLVTFLGLVTFYFANDIIPVSKQKSYSLRKNIAKVKPSIAIAEGLFSEFAGTGMTILVDDKYGEDDRFLKNVTIHKKSSKDINTTVIKAKTGEFISSEKSNIVQLVLHDGHHYEEIETQSNKDTRKHPFAFSTFSTYIINIDLREVYQVDMDEENEVNSERMKNTSQLNKDIDSLYANNKMVVSALSKNIQSRMQIDLQAKKIDTSSVKDSIAIAKQQSIDSLNSIEDIKSLLDIYQMSQINAVGKNYVFVSQSTIEGKIKEIQVRYKIYHAHILELHKKFSLALSCIILFFVGAPLGAIIRKGGLGLPMVVAVVLFLTYYFLGVFSYNYAKEGNIHPYLGAWIPTLVMLPLGVFLTLQATRDRGLMSIGSLIDNIKLKFNKKNRTNKNE